MRYTKYKWMMWLVLLCFSCVNEEQRAVLSDEPGKVRMNMSISTRATYDPEVLNENETRINRLRLYVFDGSTLDKMYYWSDLNINDGVYVTPIFLVKAATGKTFYAIVNEPTDMDSRALLEAVDHPGDLAEIQYRRRDIMDYWNPNIMGYYNDYCLPMYGELTGVDALEGTTQTINLQVDRAVARVDVYMRREIGQDENYWENRLYIEELGVDRISDIGFISPVRVPDNRYDNIYFMDRKEIREEVYSDDKGELLYSFYVPEMECIYDKLSLDFHYRYETGYDGCAWVELGGYDPYTGYLYGEILEKIERNHVYKLFCRFTQKTAKFKLNLTVCPWEYLPPQAEEVKGEVKMTNCYMVAPGGRVDIPTENVYKIWAQQVEFGNIPIPDGDVMAELVWQDEQGVIADGGITVVNALERERAYLQVRTAKEGNAVVAMKVNGEIYWSWHIWCTDYEPNVTEGQKFFNNLVWMDRNLGAMTNEYTIDGGVKGLLYEWGRKDPFPSAENWTQKEKTLYTENSVTNVRFKVAEVENLVESVREPLTYITNERSWGDWYTNSVSLMNYSLWLPNNKTIFDPCPIGWRVPPDNQPWKGLQAGSTESTQGIIHPEAGYYPRSDKRLPQDGRLISGLSHWASVASVNSVYPLGGYGYGLGQEWQPFGGQTDVLYVVLKNKLRIAEIIYSMKKYIVYLILCFVSCFIFSCTSVYEKGDTSCIPEGMERLTFKVIVSFSKVVGSNTRSIALEKENEIKDLFVKIGCYDGDHYRNFYSTQNGTIYLDSYVYEDSIYRASIEVPVGTFRDGDNIYVWANQEYPIDVTSEEELTTPLYMSGIGTIRDRWGGGREFEADVHLLRGVAKLRTVVRTTKRSVLGSWNININQVETQILHMPLCIRPFAPFETHRNPAANDWWNDVYHRYIDCTLKNVDWWFRWENSHLLSSVELPIDDGVNVDKVAETSYDRYIYENWLENESDYDENTNVTALKVRIPLWNNETGENRTIERVIPIKTNDSYRILRNHIYTVDVRVLSLDKVKIFTNMLDWEDVGVTGDIVGGVDFDIDRTKITLIKDIVDPVKLLKVDCHAPGRLQIRALKPNKTDLISTTDLQLYCNGITETDKLADNSGIYDLTAAQVMNFYCTTGSVPANYEGGFIEISSDNVHVEYIPVSSLDTFTPLDTEGTANSYIADRGAGSYSFTATIMGNGVDGIIDEGKFEDASGNILTKAGGANIHPLSAKLLWQDTDELVEQVALVNGRVQVKMGRSRGNAVIAVYDKTNPNAEDAKVLWSWHLWCTATPKILEFVTSIYTGNNYKVMDRNLGATATKAYLGTVQGLHYQWGRKDPFSGSLTYDGIRTILYDVRSGQVVYKYSDERVTAGQAISTPSSLYSPRRGLGSESWCTKTTELKYLWGNPDGEQDVFPKETLKSLYDPCPYGYKVAPHDVFKILSKGEIAIFPPAGASLGDMYFIKSYFANGSTFYYDNAGIDETKLIYLPETYRPNGDGIKLGKRGVYWCSSPHPADKEHSGLMFNFHPYTAMDFEYNIYNPVVTSTPASIRCVKE